MEAALHEYFEEYSWEPDKAFSGSTEFFKGVEEDELVRVYELALKGEDLVNDKEKYKDD